MVAGRTVGHREALSRAERWLVRVGFSIFLGWITVASVANTAQTLSAAGWDASDPGAATWGVVMLAAAGSLLPRRASAKKTKRTTSMKPFAFVFPGQGSQAVGMLDAWGDHPAVAETLAQASQALGEDIGRLIQEGPKETLALTTNTQPVMLVAGVAAYRVWRAEGGAAPAVMAGHSLGEYSALVAAGALTLAEAVPLVRFRAQAMQEAVPVGTGAMAAILGMEAQRVIEGCAEALRSFGPNSGETVEAANFNDPAQTVIAGSKAAVDRAIAVAKSRGVRRALPLAVSAPFHCALMMPAEQRLASDCRRSRIHGDAGPTETRLTRQ